MLIRQKAILALIDQMGGQVSRLPLVKMAFLLGKEYEIKTFYEFVPYHYGPYSFTLYHELEMLRRNGYILHSSKDEIQLVRDVASPPVNPSLKNQIAELLNKYRGLSNHELINYVYSGSPWYTINAKAWESRLGERPKTTCRVYMVGYEGLQIDGFLNILLETGIEQIIDVRHNPISRRYGFHKSTLSRVCGRLNIEYKHVPEVGIPSELRANLRQPSDYIPLFQEYEKKTLSSQPLAVERIANWVASKPSVLMCMESNPDCCHRSHLAELIARHTRLMIQDLRNFKCKQNTPKRKF